MNIYNWRNNCEKVLKTKQYTTKKQRVQEQTVLIQYLREQGKTYQEIYNIWYSLLPPELQDGIHNYESFNFYWGRSEKASNLLKKNNSFQIYLEEINYINSLQCENWYRKFLLGLLFFRKHWANTYSGHDMPLTRNREKDIFTLVGLSSIRVRHTTLIYQYLKRFKPYALQLSNSRYGAKVFVSLNYIQETGEPLGTYNDPIKFPELFHLLKENSKVCPSCSLEFVYSDSRIQTELCDGCYEKQRQADIAQNSKSYRKRKKERHQQPTCFIR